MKLCYPGLFAAVLLISAFPELIFSQTRNAAELSIQVGPNGKLAYKADANGDRVPDFSYCGYMLSEAPIPNVPVKVIVPLMKGDATTTIQNAIDYVSSLPPDKQGFRGTVLLERGTYMIAGALNIRSSGLVLRGAGPDSEGTILNATGVDRQTLIKIAGLSDKKIEKPLPLAETYVPVSSTMLRFKSSHSFKAGDQIIVNRPSTKEWLEKIGADQIGLHVDYQLTKWDAGDFDQNWYRKVVAVTPGSITIDIPLTNSLDPQYGGGNVTKYSWNGQITKVGVENLRCISTFDKTNDKDENHRWMAITLENVSDSWVRRITAEHFVSSAVAVWESASRITVEDCKSLAPVGETANYRRYSFQTLGQQVLFQRCYAENGYHAFSVGFSTPGPNAFVQCFSANPLNFSGAIGGWSTGVLFDKMTIDGGIISMENRDVDGQGGGWSTANSLSWAAKAAQVHVSSPPTAQNWAYGSRGQGYGNGQHALPRNGLKPESFFYGQLEARTGAKSPEEKKIYVYQGSLGPDLTPDQTAIWNERARIPEVTTNAWIDQMIKLYPIISDMSAAKKINETGFSTVPKAITKSPPVSIKNGRIVLGNEILTGRRNRTSLWRGTTRPAELSRAAPNLLRFVPGRQGRGLTDDLDTLVKDMRLRNVVAMQSFPALWYERRRDDHGRSRRANADVWAPFYEQPFSRSGQGEAYDRLSKYDLTKWNTWYWLRLKQFADLADQNGLLYLQEHYLQHNIIEEGAHWADYPWRTANNINNMGFPEMTAYAEDKRVFMGEQFYDITNKVRKDLHKTYIRKSLDNFKGNTNIIHHLGQEYTGPLHFVKFWLDVIREWEKETKQKVMVALPGTKDVQDAILADTKYSTTIDAIDIIQWQYRKDGSLYAPPGGVSLAERQYARIYNVGETSFDQVYRAVNEIHTKHPEKAIIYTRGGLRFSNWAVFMAGGSLAQLPEIKDRTFFESAAKMESRKMNATDPQQYTLGKKGLGYIVFSESGKLKIDLSDDQTSYVLRWINPATGEILSSTSTVAGGAIRSFESTGNGAAVAWLVK
ncbi:DUF6298 domain-containing protein [Pedobacter sp. P351]|uniref:DUF6298 domain-containing protein n=1 Tax=Pedobacter superstes TaxID=3133441 RepID=UPI003094F290